MTKANNWKRADDFMAELAKDPVYRDRRAAQAEKFRQRRERYAQLDKPILELLATKGFPATSLEDIVRKFAPLPEPIVAVLLAALQSCEDVRHCEGLVRALGTVGTPFDGRPLIQCYDRINDEALRFAVINTIALVRPHSIDEWLIKARQNPQLRRMLEELAGH